MMLPVNQIICGDCLEVMRGWPDGCVDAVVTDPPYGIGIAKHGNIGGDNLALVTDYGTTSWDTERVSKTHISEMLRVSKQQVIFGGNYYADLLPARSCWLVWDKDNGAANFADCELAWTSLKKAVRRMRWRWNGMLQEDMANKEHRVHPTQKPIAVMAWALSFVVPPGGIVLDPFAGSGSTCVAATREGLRYIGIDISEEYCEITRRRVAHTEKNLFADARKMVDVEIREEA